MPKIEPVKMSRPAAKPSGNGSVLSRAVHVDELSDDLISIVIYGGNRVGKTTLACEFPKPLLLVSFEPNSTGGSRSIRRIPGVAFLHLDSSQDGLALCKELIDNDGPIPSQLKRNDLRGDRFMSYVVDGATSYQDVILCEVMGWDKMPEQLSFTSVGKAGYQERAEKVKEGLRPFLRLPGHRIILAKEKDHNPPKDDYASINKLTGGLQQESHFAEDVGGSVAGWLHDACDCITRLYVAKEVKTVSKTVTLPGGKGKSTVTEEVETGRSVRRLRTLYHPNYAAGIRSASPSNIPEYVEGSTPKAIYEALMRVIRGEPLK